MVNNYTQALELLRDMLVCISTLTSGWNIFEAQYAGWLADEHKYLESKHSEPESDVLGVDYVRLLTKYAEAWNLIFILVSDKFGMHLKNYLQKRPVPRTKPVCIRSPRMHGSVNFLQQELQKVEGQLDIGARWSAKSPEFQRAAEYIRIRDYQCAVNKLEGLVVQRLFELPKANVSRTGYKQRTHISKALKARSKTIQRVLQAYNKAALTLDPPCPNLTWSQIVEYTTIAEFELLRIGA
ncbi:hypothetical protein K439DRAFT_1519701 [Ramaria rubella]|nr:hypothetical protein K439DRAFT_1519701 [Ramaria rubella]